MSRRTLDALDTNHYVKWFHQLTSNHTCRSALRPFMTFMLMVSSTYSSTSNHTCRSALRPFVTFMAQPVATVCKAGDCALKCYRLASGKSSLPR
jgi:hypothetical protein